MTRERMIAAIRELPPDASVDDAIERLVFLAKIDEGLAELDRDEGVSHGEVPAISGLDAAAGSIATDFDAPLPNDVLADFER